MVSYISIDYNPRDTPLPLTVTVGRVAALATCGFTSPFAGVATALAKAAEPAASTIEPFIMMCNLSFPMKTHSMAR